MMSRHGERRTAVVRVSRYGSDAGGYRHAKPRGRDFIPAACRVNDSVQEQTDMLTRDEYIAEAKQRLDDWSAEIDALEAKGRDLKDDAKEKYLEQLAVLRLQREEGEKKLAELQSAAESSWDRVKAESENLWEALKDSARVFRSHYK